MVHTPSPWHSYHTGDNKEIIITAGKSVYGKVICIVDYDDVDHDEQDDNVALILASPDLLGACKEGLDLSKYAAALNFSEDTGNTQEFLDELDKMLDHFQTTVRAAIAKAEGKVAQKESGQP